MTDTALERARELDEYYRRTGKLIGPLVSSIVSFSVWTITQRQHGVPISVKEHIQMKDLTCNAGFVAWYFPPSSM